MQISFFSWVCVLIFTPWRLLRTSPKVNLSIFLVQEQQKPVPVDKFPEHVQQMHSDRDKQFELEYNVSVFRTTYTEQYNLGSK